jgi:hypothetical protein
MGSVLVPPSVTEIEHDIEVAVDPEALIEEARQRQPGSRARTAAMRVCFRASRPRTAGTEDDALEQFAPAVVTDELQALIEQARRRARRRRLGWAATVIATAAAGSLAYALTGRNAHGTARGAAGRQPIGASVRSLDLSHSAGFESLALVGGRLILSGGPNGSLFPSASIAASPHWPAAARCWSAVVNPDTLKLSHSRTGGCDDPRLYGVDVLPVNFVDNGRPDASTLRIARITRHGYTVGPVVVRYSEASDTNAEWTYGDGYLWIYEPASTRGSELLQVSPTSGAVVDTIPMPMISRPLLAADADGLWLAPAVESGWNGNPVRALYLVKPGARRPQIAAREVTLARWLVAEGHSVWADVTHYPKPSTLWRFDGPKARPVSHRSVGAELDFGEFGYGEPGYAGGASGLWAVVPRGGQQVIRIDPTRGQPTRMTTIHPQSSYQIDGLQPPLVVFRGAAYILDPPAQAGTYPYRRGGFSALYRVAPSGARHAR